MLNNSNQFYFGYGLNTHRASMARRCPQARARGHARLRDYRFRFATHADIVPHAGSTVHGVLWQVTDQCMQSLDRFEGYPRYYDRRIVVVAHGGRLYRAWAYYMTPGHCDAPPPDSYWNSLLEGYAQHGVPQQQMYTAVRSAEQVLDK